MSVVYLINESLILKFVAGQFDLEFYDIRNWEAGVNLRDNLFRLDLQRCTDHAHETAEEECERCTEAARNVPPNAITADVGAAVADWKSEDRRIRHSHLHRLLPNGGAFTGKDFAQYSTMLVLRGPYKACIAEYIGEANGKAEIRLQARGDGSSVFVDPRYLYNL